MSQDEGEGPGELPGPSRVGGRGGRGSWPEAADRGDDPGGVGEAGRFSRGRVGAAAWLT